MRVYFLGAGASKAFFRSLPTAKDLTIEHLMDDSSYATTWLGAPSSEIKLLQQSRIEWRKEPIEHVIDSLSQDRPLYQAILVSMLRQLSIRDDGYPEDLLTWLKSVRDGGDVILTTNYDTLLERGVGKLAHQSRNRNGVSLANLEGSSLIDYGCPSIRHIPVQNVPVLLLKLHGSISWACCTKCHWFERGMHAQRAESALAGDFRCPECESRTEPVMVPPSRVKDSNKPFIQEIWRRAEQVLTQASEIVFGGFSMDPSDQHIREMLSSACSRSETRRVFIADLNRSGLKDRYVSVYGTRVEDGPDQSWKDYLLSSLPAREPKTRQFPSRSAR